MATLLEAYSKRLKVAESVYANAHNGETLSKFKKVTTARCLENINKFLNESFSSAGATQVSDLGQYKKFSLNLTTCALPK